MDDVLLAFPAPDPELDAAATVAYVQWLLDYDLDAHEPRLLPAFEANLKNPEEELRGISVTSVVVRDDSVQVCFTMDYVTSFEAPANADADNPVHVVHGKVLGSNWAFPVTAKSGLLTES